MILLLFFKSRLTLLLWFLRIVFRLLASSSSSSWFSTLTSILFSLDYMADIHYILKAIIIQRQFLDFRILHVLRAIPHKHTHSETNTRNVDINKMQRRIASHLYIVCHCRIERQPHTALYGWQYIVRQSDTKHATPISYFLFFYCWCFGFGFLERFFVLYSGKDRLFDNNSVSFGQSVCCNKQGFGAAHIPRGYVVHIL